MKHLMFNVLTALFVALIFLAGCQQGKEAPKELYEKPAARPAPAAGAGEEAGLEGGFEVQNIFVKVSREVMPAVVNISTYQNSKGDERKRSSHIDSSLGSGVIISPDGYILTNAHVVQDSSEIKVKLSDKREFMATLEGLDVKTDIAVLKIQDGAELPTAKLGDSAVLEIGQWAIAIGNPFGLDQTVTVGVVSGIGRADVGVAQYENFIQTDASINPGNSGGPLLNSSGEVIGINTAIMSAGQGISFAIPINMAREISRTLIEKGKVVRGWLGVGIQDLSADLAEGLGIPGRTGVLVNKVFDNSPAEKARFQMGDVIIGFDGAEITGARQLQRVVAATEVDKTVEVKLLRKGKELSLKARITEMAETEAPSVQGEAELESSPALGLTVHPIGPAAAAGLGYKGVVVVEVDGGSNADKAGVAVGDVIMSIGKKKIEGIEDFKKADGGLKTGDMVVLLVLRAKSPLYIAFRAQK